MLDITKHIVTRYRKASNFATGVRPRSMLKEEISLFDIKSNGKIVLDNAERSAAEMYLERIGFKRPEIRGMLVEARLAKKTLPKTKQETMMESAHRIIR